jgi:glycosyltransferase involved in cell wall biosynthesis
MKVIFSTPDWTISGVNTFHLNLARALQKSGHEPVLMMARMRDPGTPELPLPTDIPVEVLDFDKASYFSRWYRVIGHLNSLGPCLYIPGYDFENSCVVSALDNRVGVVGVVHSDDPYHYEHVMRMGPFWNASIAVSQYLFDKMVSENPLLRDRSYRINCGVPCAPELGARPAGIRPLRIIYTGRFREEQKRVSDLPKIARALEQRGITANWTLVGAGEDEAALRAGFAELKSGQAVFTGPIPSDAVLAHYGDHDCFLLPSNFEGLPVSLMEAMGHGVIPLATQIDSGIPEIVHHGVNGYIQPVGDVEGFAERLAEIYRTPDLRETLRRAAYETIVTSRFSIESVAERYLEVFDRVRRDIDTGTWRRPKPLRPGTRTGDITPPPHLQFAPDEVRLSPDTMWRAAIRRGRSALDRWRSQLGHAASGAGSASAGKAIQ